MSTTTSMIIKNSVRLPPPSGKKELAPPPIYDLTQLTDERSQTLKRILEQGHVTVAPLREPNLLLHSHLPHLLGSAYALGADSEQLQRTYTHEITTMVKIDERFVRGDKIDKSTWRNFLAQKSYTIAFVDFFDEEINRHNGDWKKVLEEYLYSGQEPLINGYVGGLGHPFIHLAYAYEFQSKEVASQALSMGCTEYDQLHGVIDYPIPDTSTYKTTSLGAVIQNIRHDKRFDGLLDLPGITNIAIVATQRLDVVLEHWNAWVVEDPVQSLEQICDLSVLMALSHGERPYDFFHAHIMTVAHALRVLWHLFPEERRTSILRQYALFTILQYINQLRVSFGIEEIESIDVAGRDWDWVTRTAMKHRWALDDHFFKAARAPWAFYETYGSKNDFYLKAAIKYITTFDGWDGFGEGVDGFDPAKDPYHPDKWGQVTV